MQLHQQSTSDAQRHKPSTPLEKESGAAIINVLLHEKVGTEYGAQGSPEVRHVSKAAAIRCVPKEVNCEAGVLLHNSSVLRHGRLLRKHWGK